MARFDRNQSVDPTEIQLLHLWNRCVRRPFLCGYDPLTGIDNEYRREWSRQRLNNLASIFAIEVLTYAIMSNHTYQVLRSRPDLARAWKWGRENGAKMGAIRTCSEQGRIAQSFCQQ